jgi:signal transduction histidine kinase
MERLELVPLVSEALEQTSVLAEAKQLELHAELGDAAIVVDGDAQLLRQVVTILIDNAVKYTPAPGRITVWLKQEEGFARLSVSDTGIGIEAGELERIFERFYRADKARSRETGGTGLGLAIGRFIAEAHAGTLTAESDAGKGSTFTLVLPLAKQAEESGG